MGAAGPRGDYDVAYAQALAAAREPVNGCDVRRGAWMG
jgi:hypothetical protein